MRIRGNGRIRREITGKSQIFRKRVRYGPRDERLRQSRKAHSDISSAARARRGFAMPASIIRRSSSVTNVRFASRA